MGGSPSPPTSDTSWEHLNGQGQTDPEEPPGSGTGSGTQPTLPQHPLSTLAPHCPSPAWHTAALSPASCSSW